MSQEDQELKNEKYWQVLEFLDKQVEEKKLAPELLLNFKTMIRDNKYVSTYIRALKLKMENINTLDDLANLQITQRDSKSFADKIPHEIQNIFEAWSFSAIETDPVKAVNKLIKDALNREGKICDFRDSVLPETKIGRCESDNHYENVEDSVELTDEEQEKFDAINEKDGWDSACIAFDDKYNPPNQTLRKTLYSDDDTAKFNDTHAEYICDTCYEDLDGDCEVSCDME